MSGQIARLIANIVVAGAGVVSKAFVQAYQQAVVNAKNGKTVETATVSLKNKMSKEQALEVLNLQGVPSIADIEKQFDRYFKANEPSKDGGGSYYLQSKIYRAKEALLKDHPATTPPPGKSDAKQQ
ncbi:hypothetical protein H310_02717 [Aphanomyces invadans]|uniref:Mitochondrial import inner membrane translocase subunit TIM16 n=1 Tax=Aphanomyces invadans TaxID=157072 RepID=A0A024UJ65_9STRA|nr:hypothetical protein H310_02717 [Aphanomyces invadans]ETW06461.1 hypothetical protein H310_02717 [Aphanomyces invadans]RHY27579.1 hypothetical protein DYB32_006681 [Aphanomyces invadans]|eukprot:XP_008864536.1 hypothetical protein H310_02717 [Aphanomyces invadans]